MATIINDKINQNNFFAMISLNQSQHDAFMVSEAEFDAIFGRIAQKTVGFNASATDSQTLSAIQCLKLKRESKD